MKNRFLALIAVVLAVVMLFSGCTADTNDIISSTASSEMPSSEPSDVSFNVLSSETSSEPSDEPSSEPVVIPEDKIATVSFGGDILLHTALFTTAKTEEDTYDFSTFLANGMDHFFSADWNICNMENPVDVYGDNSKIDTYPSFNAPREIIDFTKKLGIDTAIYCNNHIYDQKYAGFIATINNLRDGGLETAGAYLSEEEYNTHYIRDVNGIKMGLLCYTDHVNKSSYVKPNTVKMFKLSTGSAPAMTEDIRALREAGAEVVIVYLHWGSEYKNAPSSTQKKLARLLCEGGADVIVGGHSHCVQPNESYTYEDADGHEKTSLIMYSLGNLFTDQTSLQTMEGYGAEYVKTQYGAKVTITVIKDGETGEITIENTEYVPTFLLRKKIGYKLYKYLYLESGKWYYFDERPEIFESNKDFSACKAAYEHVVTIMGDDVPVKNYQARQEDTLYEVAALC